MSLVVVGKFRGTITSVGQGGVSEIYLTVRPIELYVVVTGTEAKYEKASAELSVRTSKEEISFFPMEISQDGIDTHGGVRYEYDFVHVNI